MFGCNRTILVRNRAMQVTRAGEYGVLGLLSLARREPGEVVMLEEVSREERIPRSFLAKIFQSLARAGLLRSIRGTRGGFSLARVPAAISTLEVIEAVEGPIRFQRCLQAPQECPHVGGCPLCGLFESAQSQVREVFARTTLADLLAAHPPAGAGDPGTARATLATAATAWRRPPRQGLARGGAAAGERAPAPQARRRGRKPFSYE
jgi:Rrf2 family transcriptional regulator, iron-sulfur cluster assembly transcription factor